jgi:predicted transcriptional regulator
MPNQFAQDEPKVAAEDRGTAQKAFIERGLASLAAAEVSGEYISSEDVLKELDEMLARAKKKKAQ